LQNPWIKQHAKSFVDFPKQIRFFICSKAMDDVISHRIPERIEKAVVRDSAMVILYAPNALFDVSPHSQYHPKFFPPTVAKPLAFVPQVVELDAPHEFEVRAASNPLQYVMRHRDHCDYSSDDGEDFKDSSDDEDIMDQVQQADANLLAALGVMEGFDVAFPSNGR